jgi:hypothetical protein
MINFAKVQLSTLRTIAPTEILAPLEGRFTHVAISGADAEPALFRSLVQEATTRNIKVLWWACPGYWNVMRLPERLSIKAAWPEAPRDWPNFSLEEVRTRTFQYIADFANHTDFAGVLLDYIRYPWGPIAQKPDLFSPNDITTTVRNIRDALEISKILVANVGPNYIPVGQHWPTWLQQNLVHSVNVRCYVHPDHLPTTLETLPTAQGHRQDICIAPAGTQKLEPLSPAQLTLMLDIAARYTKSHVSVFDWRAVTAADYWHLFRPLPEPKKPVFTASVKAIFWDDGSVTFHWDALT